MSLCYRGALTWGFDPSPCPFQVTNPLHSTAFVFSCMLSVSHLTTVLAHVAHQLGAPQNSLLTTSLLEDISERMCGEVFFYEQLIFVVNFVCCVCLTMTQPQIKTILFMQV